MLLPFALDHDDDDDDRSGLLFHSISDRKSYGRLITIISLHKLSYVTRLTIVLCFSVAGMYRIGFDGVLSRKATFRERMVLVLLHHTETGKRLSVTRLHGKWFSRIPRFDASVRSFDFVTNIELNKRADSISLSASRVRKVETIHNEQRNGRTSSGRNR